MSEVLTAPVGRARVHERGAGGKPARGAGTVAAAVTALAAVGSPTGTLTVHVPGGRSWLPSPMPPASCVGRQCWWPAEVSRRLVERDGVIPGGGYAGRIQMRGQRHVPPIGYWL